MRKQQPNAEQRKKINNTGQINAAIRLNKVETQIDTMKEGVNANGIQRKRDREREKTDVIKFIYLLTLFLSSENVCMAFGFTVSEVLQRRVHIHIWTKHEQFSTMLFCIEREIEYNVVQSHTQHFILLHSLVTFPFCCHWHYMCKFPSDKIQ